MARLTGVPGIGKKTAERIVLELKDRVAGLGVAPAAEAPAASPQDQLKGDVLSALQNLGYHRPLAEKAVDAALADAATDAARRVVRARVQERAQGVDASVTRPTPC